VSVTYTLTANVIPDESRGRNWYSLIIKGTGTGDGSGGVIDGTIDIAPYVRPGDQLWIEEANFANEDVAAVKKHTIQVDQQSWSAMQAPSGVLSILCIGDQSTAVFDGTYGGTSFHFDRPMYLGKCLVATSNNIYFKSGANTNGKAYRCWARFSFLRPPS